MDLSARARGAAGAAALALLAGCGGDVVPPAADQLATGTWGGENAGMIVQDSVAHVHVGCTYGDFRLPFALEADGRIAAAGSYLLRAYPVAAGPTLPARLDGRLDGELLTFTVTVTDTIEGRIVTLGPASVRHRREPELGPCPICVVPGARG